MGNLKGRDYIETQDFTLDEIEKYAIKGIKGCAADELMMWRCRIDAVDWLKSSLHMHLSNMMIATAEQPKD